MNHPIFSNQLGTEITRETRAMCEPLFKKTGITYFLFARIFTNGSMDLVTTFPALCKNHLSKEYPLQPYVSEKIITQKFCYIIQANALNGAYNQAIDDMRNIFDVDNIISFVERYPYYLEMCFFGARSHADHMINFYLNQKEMLEKFILYFKQNSSSLIKKIETNRIILPVQMVDDTTSTVLINNNINQNKHCKEQYDSAHYKLHANGKNVVLTSREISCLKYLAQGYSAKEIGRHLLLSYRTVESYTNNIKLKLDCHKKSELIAIAIQNRLIY